jgi:hypothetical protein
MKDHVETDIGTAAYLTACGFPLLDLVSVGPNRYAFRFADPDSTAEETARNYFAGAPAEAKALVDTLRNLKDRLYAVKGNGNRNGNYNARYSR